MAAVTEVMIYPELLSRVTEARESPIDQQGGDVTTPSEVIGCPGSGDVSMNGMIGSPGSDVVLRSEMVGYPYGSDVSSPPPPVYCDVAYGAPAFPYVMYALYPVCPTGDGTERGYGAQESCPAPPSSPPPQAYLEDYAIGVFGADGCWYPRFGPIRTPDPPQVSPEAEHGASDVQVGPVASQAPPSPPSPPPAPQTLTPPPTAPLHPLTPLTVPYYNYFHHLDLPMSVLGRPRLLHTRRRPGQLSVEDLWVKHMAVLFKNLPDHWVITPASPDRPPGPHWFTFKDLAKVRFYCKSCSDGWTSMYGVVIFYYRWDKRALRGQILYQVPGQKCGSCASDEFRTPMWYPEEAQKVITNLYYKIAAHFYSLVTPQFIRTRRIGQPSAHHNRRLCEGCVQGVCKVERDTEQLIPS